MLRRHEQRLALMTPAEPAALRGLPLFAGLPDKARDKVIEKARRYMSLASFEPGDTILREGDYSDTAHVVMEGSVHVALAPRAAGAVPRVRGGAHTGAAAAPRAGGARMLGRAPASSGVVLSAFPVDVPVGDEATLGPGEIFGEISALSRYPVSATVQATTRVRLLLIRLPALRMLMAASKQFRGLLDARYRERTLLRHLRNVPLLAVLDEAAVASLKDKAELLSFEPGQLIAAEGAAADSLLLVRGGYVKVGVRSGTSELALTYLRKGDFAGEASLLIDEPWPFTLQALEHVELVKLARNDFLPVAQANPAVLERLWAELLALLKLRGAVARNPATSQYVQMAMDTGLIHGESVLLIDLSTCTRCDECVRGCADTHGGVPRFIREGQRYRNWLIPKACYQCTDPVCMIDCPTGAITRAASTLEVTIDRETCIGCSNCADRCPWSNIVMVETGERRADGKPVEIATKCDLCLTREAGPACVQMCPHGSAIRISFKDMERVTATLR